MLKQLSQSQKNIYGNWPLGKKTDQFSHQFNVTIHGLVCCFLFDQESLLRELQDYFPQHWQVAGDADAIKIYWHSPEEFGDKVQGRWGDSVEPNCFFIDEYVFQRDFCVRRIGDNEIELVAECRVDDGLFNFLRYFLPEKLLAFQKVLFHSACLLDEEERAFLFFGFSGAGKTTLTRMCQQATAVGDDMSLISLADDQVWVEPALVGQQIYNKSLFANRYPVKAAFWLNKSDELSISSLEKNRRGRLLSSFAGLFWDQLSPLSYQTVFNILSRIEQTLPLYNLNFSLQSEVWNAVRKVR